MTLGQRLAQFFIRLFGSPFLCDSCKYNYGSACLRPQRPNATSCPDYRRR